MSSIKAIIASAQPISASLRPSPKEREGKCFSFKALSFGEDLGEASCSF